MNIPPFISTAMAAGIDPLTPNAHKTPVEIIQNLFGSLREVALLVAGAAAVVYLAWSGIQYVMAGGAPDKVKSARQGIINAVIGILVIAAAYGIMRLAMAVGSKINEGLGHP